MVDKNTLEQVILDDLQKTGYPTEIISASVMQKRGWTVIHNPSYWDKEEQQSREFDIRAFKKWKANTSTKEVLVYLIAECKKSEKPWVFFTTNEYYKKSRLGSSIKVREVSNRLFTNKEQADVLITDDELRSFHHYYQSKKLARTFYEPMKQQEKASHSAMIYTAIMSAIKATLFNLIEQAYENSIRIYYPVVIFNGNLFEAFVKPDKTIELTKTNHIQLSFHYMQQDPGSNSIWRAQQEFIIDIIHEDYLDDYLMVIENEHEFIAAKI